MLATQLYELYIHVKHQNPQKQPKQQKKKNETNKSFYFRSLLNKDYTKPIMKK